MQAVNHSIQDRTTDKGSSLLLSPLYCSTCPKKLTNSSDILCDLPRKKGRRAEGDSRRRLDSDDLLDLDASKAHLPLFTAVNSKRLSPFSVSDADLCAITVNIMEMKNQLEKLRVQLPSLIKSQLASGQLPAMMQTASASASQWPAVGSGRGYVSTGIPVK